MKRLFRNIGTLAGIVPAGIRRKEGAAMDEVGTLTDAWLLAEGGRIAAFGDTAVPEPEADEVVDCDGGLLIPAFCDSHTHIVYAGCRDGEFLDKIRGLSYEEIAARGGGILNSADLLHKTPEEELFRQSMQRVDEMIAQGTGAIEIKSGY
ncbi:MAG: imidazolonepropionase, partial [Bacteroidales bacterium]|nr:imidazolonepropionase [Bacteroidales bacterium]